MADIASVFQTVQLGVEATRGTQVPANRYLEGLAMTVGIQAETKKYRAAGRKHTNIVVPTKEWTQGSAQGPMSYTDIIYGLSGCITKPTPTAIPTTIGGKQFKFFSNPGAADAPATYSAEMGSPERAVKFGYLLFNSLELSWGDDGADWSGNWLAQRLTDDIGAMTSVGLQTVECVPVTRNDVCIYVASSLEALDTAQPLQRAMSVKWSLGNRFAPIWVLNRNNKSWVGHVEQPPELKAVLQVEADDEGMEWLPLLRGGTTRFMRVECFGPEYEPGFPFKFILDGAFKVSNPSDFQDMKGVQGVEWTLEGVESADWEGAPGRAYEITVETDLASL